MDIQQELNEIRGVYDVLDMNDAFALWAVATLHFDHDLSPATLEEVFNQTYLLEEEQGPGDKCLDGYFLDETGPTLYLYQAKWLGEAARPSIANAREVAVALNALSSDSGRTGLPQARRKAADALRDVVERNGRIVLRGVCNRAWRAQHREAALEVVDTNLRALTGVELLGPQDLLEAIAQSTADLAGTKVTFDLFGETSDPILDLPPMGAPGLGESVVALLSGTALAKIAARFRDTLFDRNVRLFLGKGRGPNKDIKETLEDSGTTGRVSFWYGHNGMTIVCDAIQILGPREAPNSLRLENPQIVNGCQTARTLAELSNEGPPGDDFAVLAKVIQLEGTAEERQDAAELIAFRANNQSPVNSADLRSNETRQKVMQEKLAAWDPKWFYERKRGEWASLPPNRRGRFRSSQAANRVMTKDEYQQSWRAYTGEPSAAITKKNAVWEKGPGEDLYRRVFDLNRRACDAVLVAVLFDWFGQVFAVRRDGASHAFDIFPGLREHGARIRRAKVLIAAHTLALFGHAVRDAYEAEPLYPETCIKRIVTKLHRGAYVRRNWSRDSWEFLKPLMSTLTNVWATYIVRLDDKENLYGSLKRPNEAAFLELVDYFKGLQVASSRDLVTPA